MTIAVKLAGGLGNQMFQYALGRRLADERGEKLLLDVSYYQKAKHCQFVLDKFNVRFDLPTQEDSTIPFQLIQEPNLAYHPEILELKGDLMLAGYWQNPKYTEATLESLRKDFIPKQDVNPSLRPLMDLMTNSNSVAVHVRGGDYKGWRKFDVATPKYYQEAFKKVDSEVFKPAYVVFTNDREYAEWILYEVLQTHKVIIVNGQDWEEIYMMSKCNHHIIVNSSFSWWGSQLCNNLDKRVIAPSFWFHSDGQTNEHLEISPYTQKMMLIEP